MKGCRTLSENEIKTLINKLEIRDKVLVLTGLTFGTRISETLALTFGDVAGTYLFIRSAKGSENASFEIPAIYHQVIADLKETYTLRGITVTDHTPLFLSRQGRQQAITRQQASQTIKKVCRALGIDGKVNSHSFRKNFVTKIYALTGNNIAETKNYSRHKSLSNLDYYIQTTNSTGLVGKLSWM